MSLGTANAPPLLPPPSGPTSLGLAGSMAGAAAASSQALSSGTSPPQPSSPPPAPHIDISLIVHEAHKITRLGGLFFSLWRVASSLVRWRKPFLSLLAMSFWLLVVLVPELFVCVLFLSFLAVLAWNYIRLITQDRRARKLGLATHVTTSLSHQQHQQQHHQHHSASLTPVAQPQPQQQQQQQQHIDPLSTVPFAAPSSSAPSTPRPSRSLAHSRTPSQSSIPSQLSLPILDTQLPSGADSDTVSLLSHPTGPDSTAPSAVPPVAPIAASEETLAEFRKLLRALQHQVVRLGGVVDLLDALFTWKDKGRTLAFVWTIVSAIAASIFIPFWVHMVLLGWLPFLYHSDRFNALVAIAAAFMRPASASLSSTGANGHPSAYSAAMNAAMVAAALSSTNKTSPDSNGAHVPNAPGASSASQSRHSTSPLIFHHDQGFVLVPASGLASISSPYYLNGPQSLDESSHEDSRSQASMAKKKDGLRERISTGLKKRQTELSGVCASCRVSFSGLLVKRLTCANCGDAFCSNCASQRVTRAVLGATAPAAFEETVRVCNACYEGLTKRH